ncbi:MAG: phosphonate transporter [Planctomycetaceae bacterium]|nr:phosphonate transporter [Planctomycetaceae bacterium]
MDRAFLERSDRLAAQMAQDSRFAADDLLARLPEVPQVELDAVPHGAVRLDEDGRVLAYNSFESKLSGIAPGSALGRDFFRDLAPCTNNSLFRGLFRRGVAQGSLDHLMPYTYTLRMAPTHVVVHLFGRAGPTGWWLFSRRAGSAA